MSPPSMIFVKNTKILTMQGASFDPFLPIVLKIISRYQTKNILHISINIKFLHISIPAI